MATEPESKIPVCPICGGNVYHVANTWTTKDGIIHRQRICALCESWAYQSEEKPEKMPELVEKAPESTANANVADSGLTKTVPIGNLTAKAGGRVPPWKRTRPPAVQPTRKG